MAEVEFVANKVLSRNHLIKSEENRDKKSDNKIVATTQWGVEHLGSTAAGFGVRIFIGSNLATGAAYGAGRAALSRAWELRQGLGQAMNRSHIREAGANPIKLVGGALKEAEVFPGQVAVNVATNFIGEKVIASVKKENRRKELNDFIEETCTRGINGEFTKVLDPNKVKTLLDAKYHDVMTKIEARRWADIDYNELKMATKEMSLLCKTLGRDLDLGAYREQANLKDVYRGMDRDLAVAHTDVLWREMMKRTQLMVVALKGYTADSYDSRGRVITKTNFRASSGDESQMARKCTQLLASAKRGRLNRAGASVLYVAGGAAGGFVKGGSGFLMADWLVNNPWVTDNLVKVVQKTGKTIWDPIAASAKPIVEGKFVQDFAKDLAKTDLWKTIAGWWEGINKMGPPQIPDAHGHGVAAGAGVEIDNKIDTAGEAVRRVIVDENVPIWGEQGARNVWGPLSEASINTMRPDASMWQEFWNASFKTASQSPNTDTLEVLLKNTQGTIPDLDSIIDKVQSVPGYAASLEVQGLWNGLDIKKVQHLVEVATADPGAGKYSAIEVKDAVQELQHLWGQLPPGDKYANLIQDVVRNIK